MQSKITLILSFLLFSIFISAQTENTTNENYQLLWTKIYSLENAGLPRTALPRVEKVYEKAILENNTEQLVKALIFKMKFSYAFEADNYAKQILNLEKDITKLNFPDSALVHSMLGEMYWVYFKNNRYRFYNRSKTTEYEPEDLKTWSLNQIFEKARYHYILSLKEKDLLYSLHPDSLLNENIKPGFPENFQFKTMYDFLAFRAIDFLKSEELSINDFTASFKLDDEDFFDTAEQYLKLDLHTSNSPSHTILVLRIFQDLLKKHKQEGQHRDFLLTDLHRINFAHQKSTNTDKNKLYIRALENLLKHTKEDIDLWGEVNFHLAKAIYNRGFNYSQKATSNNRWDYKTAFDICSENTAKRDVIDAWTFDNCQGLINSITSKSISVQTEDVFIPNEASPALISYRNIDSVYVRVLKTTYKAFDSIQKKLEQQVNRYEHQSYQKLLADTLQTQQPYTQFSIKLPETTDYRQHSVEAILPELPAGQYVYLFSANPTFNYSENAVVITFKSVSNISYVLRTDNKGNLDYVMLHRQNGKPLANIKVNPYAVKYDYRERKTSISVLPQQETNSEGFVRIKTSSNGRTQITVFSNEDDNLSTKNYQVQRDNGIYTYRRRDRDKWETKTVFFTDRAIYRPGQTLFFKGIVYITDFDKEHEIQTDYKTIVSLYDVNNQKISELEVETNEFGTFSGSFVLPQGVLNGNMRIREFNGQKGFRVEEYKRPTFEVVINKTKGTPKLGEKIKVSGLASAFSGAPIDGAKVKYTINRNLRLPRWIYGSRFSQPTHITSGESVTNEEGEFEIEFTALSDNAEIPIQHPVFYFEVKVDITDTNGETRSALKTVPVSDRALLLKAGISGILNKNELKAIKISTTNLEDEFEAAKGKIKIFKLENPKQLYKKRLWSVPDTFMYTEAEFRKKLPLHQYREENNSLKWRKEKTVIEEDFDTGISKSIKLKNTDKWPSGKYVAELMATDKFGEEVKWKSYFTLYSDSEKNVPFKTTDFFNLQKKKAEPGENLELLAGTSEKEINVLFEIEQKGKILDKRWIKIKNRLEKITIPITEEYCGNISLKYVFVKNGRVYNHSETVNIPYPQNKIKFNFETFRNKLIPGEKEQWRIKLSANDGEKVVAEMVATLYDASLDEFRVNTFDFNLDRFWRAQLRWQSTNNFNASHGMFVSEFWNKPNSTREMRLNNLQWYGFSYNYSPHFSEQGIYNLKNGSIIILSSEKGDKIILSGTIRDANNEVMPGATVTIKGTNTGVVADSNGKFKLGYEGKKATMMVSFVGMKNFEFEVSGTTVVDVMLAYDNQALDEVVAVGYGSKSKQDLTGSSIRIRGTSSIQSESMVEFEIADDDISLQLQGTVPGLAINRESAIKPPLSPLPAPIKMDNISTRKNLQETAFFYPHLRTNPEGEIIINFTIPEALTKWKMLGFAHTKDLKYGLVEKELITSKDLMVVPNLPRFLREGDRLTLTSKVVNLSDRKLEGTSKLMLFNALNMQPIDIDFENTNAQKAFQVEAGQSTLVSWNLQIPEGIEAVTCRVVAQSGNFTDGEEKAVPILTNRMLVTETLPLWVREGQEKTFVLDKLANTQSDTRTNHSLTLEFTANPAWYAIQALPYLMEFPHECMEQTFSRYYANSIASSIINSNPKIKRVFESWKVENNGEAFISKLEQNPELKQMLLQETPWVLDAQNETERNKRIALLFDLNKMSQEQNIAIRKLKKGQYPSGGWPWFSGGKESTYITQHIVNGFGHMRKMGVMELEKNTELWQMIKKAVNYLDTEIQNDYKRILREKEKKEKKYDRLSPSAIQYLYGRSFFKDIPISEELAKAIHYFKRQAENKWSQQNNYLKGMIALVLFRDGQKDIPEIIVKSLKEHAKISDELGMYWKTQWSYYWYQAPVETQALMIELFSEVTQDTKAVDNMRVWLLKNKQTTSWKTTKATTEACYALLLNGTDWLASESNVEFKIGGKKFDPKNDETVNNQAGTGYFKKVWHSTEISPNMANITITKPDPGISWGGIYWQYFEQLDKITSAETPLKIEKKLFREIQTESGKEIVPVENENKLKVGDKVIVRIVLSTDRDMEFVHLKDMRASCFEPVRVLSGYKYQDGLGYYQSTKDASMNFFMDYLRKGDYVLEYPLWISHTGNFSNGITSVQSMYAPEFSSHSEGVRVVVE